MFSKFFRAIAVALSFFSLANLKAQVRDANYDEAKAGNHPLPDPLRFEDGSKVADAKAWRERRRPEILRLFEEHVYGRAPGKPAVLRFKKILEDKQALSGAATRREVVIYLTEDGSGPRLDLQLWVPNQGRKPAPAFVGLNFDGNQTVDTDPAIPITANWVHPGKKKGLVNNQATEESRGIEAESWQVRKIIGRGYALATMSCNDIDPDFHDGFKNGVHPLYDKFGSSERPSGAWGTIAAWAWGLSRIVDYLETDADIDAKKIALIGHSRLGKTALWAGAVDERFAIVISNNSGCGGAALSRRDFGETVARINTSFPHWFNGNFKKYNNNETACPVDQHQLIALIAPRPVYVASAEEDRWADPKGEFLGAKHADPVYKLLGTEGLPAAEMPSVNQPVMGAIGYHLRTGAHDVTEYDWTQYLAFADKHFGIVSGK